MKEVFVIKKLMDRVGGGVLSLYLTSIDEDGVTTCREDARQAIRFDSCGEALSFAAGLANIFGQFFQIEKFYVAE